MFFINNALRKARHFFSTSPVCHATIFEQQTSTFFKIQKLIPLILIVFSYFAFLQVRHKVYLLDSANSPGLFFYIKYMNEFFYLFFRWLPAPLLLIAAYFSNLRWLRNIALFSFIQQGALVNAIDVNENMYRPAIWLAVALLFLPKISDDSSRIERAKYISHFWFSLLFFSFAYYVAGFWKVAWGCIYQPFMENNLGFWNINAMSYTITEYLLRTATVGKYPIAEWAISVPTLGWALLLAAAYAEATLWIVFFRPSLWKTYGVLMILLHTGSKMTLNIGFEAQYILTGLLFFLSPFAVEKNFFQTIVEMPGIYFFYKKLRRHISS